MTPPEHAEPIVLPKGTLKRIHINRATIGRYLKTGVEEAAVIVVTSKGRVWGTDVEIRGPSTVVQRLTKPLQGCGARVWIESRAEVVVTP